MKSSILIKLLLVVVAFSSCKSYNYNNYIPEPAQGAKKLLGLIPSEQPEHIFMFGMPLIIESNKEVYSLHQDGLKSITNDSLIERYGYYTFTVNKVKTEQKGLGLYLFSGMLIAPGLLGVPYMFMETDLDVNFQIFDAKKRLVAKYNVKVDPKRTKAWVGLYFSYSEKNVRKVSALHAHKLAFEEFSALVAKDVDAINAKLLIGGTVKIEKSDVIGNSNETVITLDPNREINKEKGGGTGFLISENGYVITNYHVIEDARKIELFFPTDSSTTKYTATIVSSDKTNDIAVLKIDSGFVSPATIPYTFSDEYDVSDEVFTIGYPQPDIMGSAYKYTKGEISSLSGIENNITMMQITTPIQPGNSGGALFNKKGDIIGITTSTLNPFYMARYQGNIPQNVNYAVKSDYVKPLVKQYLSKQPNTLADKPLAEQIKILSKFTCLIKVY